MKLKPLLNYLLKEQVEEGIRSVNHAPTPFNIREFKALKDHEEIVWYAEERLKPIGEGSSRIVYILSPKYALKIAYLDDDGYDDGTAPDSIKGIAQNEAEFNTYMEAKDSSIIPKVQDYHPGFLWLIVELVRPLLHWTEFRKLTGINQRELDRVLDTVRYAEHGKELDLDARLRTNPLTIGIKDLALRHDISPDDMRGLRQWGKASDGRIVLLDTGATYDVLENLYEQAEHETDLDGLKTILVRYNQNKNHPVLINVIRALEENDLNHALYLIKNDRDKFEPDERAWLRNMGLL